MSFRLAGKYLILTYPKCGLDADVIVYALKTRLKNFSWCVVSREQHADGTPHRHVFVALSKRCDLHTPACLDVSGFHGNYQVARSLVPSFDYVIKDKEVSYHGVADEKSARESLVCAGKAKRVWEEIDSMVDDGKSTRDIVAVVGYRELRKIDEAVCQRAIWSLPVKPDFFGVVSKDVVYGNLQIAAWINENVKKDRSFKQSQLYVHGSKNLGKTTLLNLLQTVLNVYVIPYDGEWFDAYHDDYDLVVFDEFRGQYTVQMMNSFLDGSTRAMRRRGKSPYVKAKNLPVIIMSNYSPGEAYSKVAAAQPEKLETFVCRLKVVEVTELVKVVLKDMPIVPVPEVSSRGTGYLVASRSVVGGDRMDIVVPAPLRENSISSGIVGSLVESASVLSSLSQLVEEDGNAVQLDSQAIPVPRPLHQRREIMGSRIPRGRVLVSLSDGVGPQSNDESSDEGVISERRAREIASSLAGLFEDC